MKHIIKSNFRTYWVFVVFLVLSNCSKGSHDGFDSNLDTTPPTAPSNLIATDITSTSVKLSWAVSNDDNGVKDYGIYRDGALLNRSIAPAYNVTGLTANKDYSFKVNATDNAGNSSEFSNTVLTTTLSEDSTLQIASGDIEMYVGLLINNAPGNSGNNYKVPTIAQLDTWNLVIDALLANNISEAVLESSKINYQITEFTDNTLSPNQVFYILEEKSTTINYWGTYVFSKSPMIPNLILMAPHSKYDSNTGLEATYCFKQIIPKALFINGAHRCNNSLFSSCSGTTSACATNEPFRVSDLAHNTISAFQKTTENIYNNVTNSVFIQLHGFAKQESDPFVIMSNGTRETPTNDYATLIKEALLVEDNTLTFKLAHIDTNWTRLIAFTNTQGRLINSSQDVCDKSATTTSGRFIHIEQEKSKLREDEASWIKMSNALKTVFN